MARTRSQTNRSDLLNVGTKSRAKVYARKTAPAPVMPRRKVSFNMANTQHTKKRIWFSKEKHPGPKRDWKANEIVFKSGPLSKYRVFKKSAYW